MVKLLKSNEFENEIKEGVVIVDFFAKWCGPCKMQAPIFEQLSSEMEEKVKFLKVDVDECNDIANLYDITNIPALVIFKDGMKQGSLVGFSRGEIIKEKLDKYL